MKTDDEISLKEAAELARRFAAEVNASGGFADLPDDLRPSNQPGVEATAHIDAMLAASRRNKTVRKP